MAEEKGFCELLIDQLIDERKAVKVYERLRDVFEEEKKLFEPHELLVKVVLGNVLKDEETHAESLERMRKLLCEVKE